MRAPAGVGWFLSYFSLTLLGSASSIDGRGVTSSRTIAETPPHEFFAFSGLPVDFVENRGQWTGSARFVARQERLTASLEPGFERRELPRAGHQRVELELARFLARLDRGALALPVTH